MGDLISREELTKKLEYLCDCLCDYSKRQRKFMCDACKLGAVIDTVEEMPSVEPERKPGKWIEHEWAEEENGLLISNWECNLCATWERKKSDFCPNCGAKMEVEE